MTGNSLLRAYMKRDKGNQVSERPQAFFLPLDNNDQESPDNNHGVIDLETTDDKDVANLQEALRKNRPDYIANAEERAGRLSRNNEERKVKEEPVNKIKTRESKIPKSNSSVKMSQSYPNPRVNSILKTNNSLTNGIQKNIPKRNEKNIAGKKSVTIVPNG